MRHAALTMSAASMPLRRPLIAGLALGAAFSAALLLATRSQTARARPLASATAVGLAGGASPTPQLVVVSSNGTAGADSAAEHLAGGVAFSNGSLGVFKRTHACTNALASAKFMQRYVGLLEQLSYTTSPAVSDDDDDGSNDITPSTAGDDVPYLFRDDDDNSVKRDYCYLRAEGIAAGEWSVHDVETERYLTGALTPAHWWYYMRQMHGAFESDAFKGWDEFMAYSIAYYVDDLTMHMDRWTQDGVEHLAYKYINGADNATMYAGLLFNAYTGEVTEVHSGRVDASYKSHFSWLPHRACVDAFAIKFPLHFMLNNYHRSAYKLDLDDDDADDANDLFAGSSVLTGAGLPWAMPWKVSWPTSDAKRAHEWLHLAVGKFVAPQHVKCSTGCQMTELLLRMTASAPNASNANDDLMWYRDAPVLVRFVQNDDAGKNGLSYGIAELEEYVEGVHQAYLGFERGWDRWIDNHVGLAVDAELGLGHLDHIGRDLAAAGVRFHAHVDDADTDQGSIWTQGVVGLGFEIHGSFDWSWFNRTGGAGRAGVHPLSFCDYSSEQPLVERHDSSATYHPLKDHLTASQLSSSDDALTDDADDKYHAAGPDGLAGSGSTPELDEDRMMREIHAVLGRRR